MPQSPLVMHLGERVLCLPIGSGDLPFLCSAIYFKACTTHRA